MIENELSEDQVRELFDACQPIWEKMAGDMAGKVWAGGPILKPCPFCGSDEIHTYSPSPYEIGNDASVNCENPICGAEVRGRTLKEAIAKWNRRVKE